MEIKSRASPAPIGVAPMAGRVTQRVMAGLLATTMASRPATKPW